MSAVDHLLRRELLHLGEEGTLRALAEPSRLLAGCDRLRTRAYGADALGIYLSVIATAGLALPMLRDRADAVHASAADGRVLVAVAITEAQAGSDVMGMRTSLRRAPDGSLRLDGSKWHVTNAPVADFVIVFAIDATTDDRFLSAVLVPASARGVHRGPALDTIGARTSPTGEVRFEGVEVVPGQILGGRQDGRQLLELAFLRERVLAPWPLLGKMEKVLEECLDHVERREQFGAPLHAFQYVQEKIVSSFDALVHARELATAAARSVAGGAPQPALASLAKSVAADAAAHVFRAAIEIHGSYGVQTARRYGEYLNDALCAQIAGGTRETHKKVLFNALRLERSRTRKRLGNPSPLLRGDPMEKEVGDG